MSKVDDIDRERQMLDDLALVRGTLRNDPDAIGGFVAKMRFVPRALASKNIQFGRPLGAAELEDLSQDVLAVIWKKRAEYSGAGTLEAWTYRFCFLQFLGFLRKRRRYPRSFEMLEDGFIEPEAPPMVYESEHEAIYAGLAHVGPPDEEIVRLKHLDSLTFAQISDRLGISSNTIKSRYYRGLKRLRQYLVVALPLAERGGA